MIFGPTLGRILLVITAFLLTVDLGFGQVANRAEERRVILLAAIEGPIGPATAHHIEKVLEQTSDRDIQALILRIDTPGGLASSMREIISAILTSPVPVIGYVAPPGAHAASAGTYILYATHVAAMAPGTNLGAATPVQIGGMPGVPKPADREPPGQGSADPDAGQADNVDNGKDSDVTSRRPLAGADAMTAKATNDAVAFIRSLAEMHGRNADWAERAVREAASLSSAEALERGVIDLMAVDLNELLDAIDGRTVTIAGVDRVIMMEGATIETIEPDAITQVLGVLSNPNLAFVLMLIGVYGIIFEFINPGSVAPGVIGAISLTLGLYALNQLPLDYAGLALLMLGIAFMVAEGFTPAFGVLGFGGLAAFLLGSAMLIDTDAPSFQISWWIIATMTVVSCVVLVLLLGVTWRSYRRVPVTGTTRLAGEQGRVLDWSKGTGHVWARGERWHARSANNFTAGTIIQIEGIDGLTLIVGEQAVNDPRAARREEQGGH